jgi:hypothetical protein
MVPTEGVEPTHPHGYQILSLARLPIPPHRPPKQSNGFNTITAVSPVEKSKFIKKRSMGRLLTLSLDPIPSVESPSTNLQAPEKFQTSKSIQRWFEVWSLRFPWSLVLGIWSFEKPPQRSTKGDNKDSASRCAPVHESLDHSRMARPKSKHRQTGKTNQRRDSMGGGLILRLLKTN